LFAASPRSAAAWHPRSARCNSLSASIDVNHPADHRPVCVAPSLFRLDQVGSGATLLRRTTRRPDRSGPGACRCWRQPRSPPRPTWRLGALDVPVG
jgi:hypothetical protein